jgi:hypothetical protein
MTAVAILCAEILGILGAGLAVRLLVRRLGVTVESPAAFAAGVLVVLALLGVAGLADATRDTAKAVRDGASLSPLQRDTAGAEYVTSSLRRLGVTRAVRPIDGVPTWIRFCEWLRTHLPHGARVEVLLSARAERAQARFWLNYRLLPRIAVGRSKADWVVTFDRAPSVSDARQFRPGFTMARRR